MARGRFWNGRDVMITGASGLVGSWLVEELLQQGAKIVCLVRDHVPDSRFFSEGFSSRVTVARGDVEEAHAVSRVVNEYEPKTVFHLGAQAIVQTANRAPIDTFKANIEGTWNVLEACRMHDQSIEQIIVASSDKAYGDQKALPYTEETPLHGMHPYDVSKSCADLISQSYAKTYGLPVAISRCGNFFGGGDLNFNRIVPGTIRSLYKNAAPEIRTDGKFVRDYIYVKDAVSAYATLAEKYSGKLKGEAFNFSNEVQMTTLDMVDMIEKLMKKKIPAKVLNNASGEIRNQHLSAKKAREILGWKSEYGIENGLKETIAWYQSYFRKN